MATYCGLMLVFAAYLVNFYSTLCFAIVSEGALESHSNLQGPFYQEEHGGFCAVFFERETNSMNQDKFIKVVYLGVNLCELVPFLSFFLLDRPHDCFVCVGRDPDRGPYSAFQLS